MCLGDAQASKPAAKSKIHSHSLWLVNLKAALQTPDWVGVAWEPKAGKSESRHSTALHLTSCRRFLFQVSAFLLEFMFWEANGEEQRPQNTQWLNSFLRLNMWQTFSNIPATYNWIYIRCMKFTYIVHLRHCYCMVSISKVQLLQLLTYFTFY